jgi:hypothetical protein
MIEETGEQEQEKRREEGGGGEFIGKDEETKPRHIYIRRDRYKIKANK